MDERFTNSELSSMDVNVKSDLIEGEIKSIGNWDFYAEAQRLMEKYKVNEKEIVKVYQNYIEEVFYYIHEGKYRRGI